jgi:hypothetical protein
MTFPTAAERPELVISCNFLDSLSDSFEVEKTLLERLL